MGGLDANIVGGRLGLSARAVAWLDGLPVPAGPPEPVLPDDDTARSWLARLAVEPDAWPEILATRPDRVAHPELWWVFDRTYRDLTGNAGNGTRFAGWPALPAGGSAPLRHLYIWAFLAAVPDIRQFHAVRGIPDQVSWASLRSLGRAVTDSRAIFGTSGLLFDLWVQPLAFRGVHYQIGRLAYDLGGTPRLNAGGVNLQVHIGGGRPLLPHECDQSFAQALDFFGAHFPERPVRRFQCHSWLLDDQLAEYLPQSSNIVRFQRRFRLVPYDKDRDGRADNAVLEYVFERMHADDRIPDGLLHDLPQKTTLQRAFVSHLRAGRHWYIRTGSFPVTAIRPAAA